MHILFHGKAIKIKGRKIIKSLTEFFGRQSYVALHFNAEAKEIVFYLVMRQSLFNEKR